MAAGRILVVGGAGYLGTPACRCPAPTTLPVGLVATSERIRRDPGWKPEFRSRRRIIQTAWAWHSGGDRH